MNEMIIKQLEKALDCEDDKELRLRVEVLLDILKETHPAPTPMSVPLPTYYENTPTLQPPYQVTSSAKKKKGPQGAGAIMSSNGEQLNYLRPAGT